MIRGQKVAIPKNIDFNASIHNRFDIEVIDTRTGKVRQRAQAENVICNGLWSRLLDNYFYNISYGSGTGVPSASDTALFNFVGDRQVGNAVYESDIINGIVWIRQSIQLSPETAVGVSISEVGIQSRYDILATHAMLEDMNGNQIVINKTATDIINIYATVYLHFKPIAQQITDGIIWSVPIPTVSDGTSTDWDIGVINRLLGDTSSRSTSGDAGIGGGYGGSQGFSGNTISSPSDKVVVLTMERRGVEDVNQYNGLIYINLSGFNFSTFGDWRLKDVIIGEAIGTGDGIKKDFSTKFPFATNATLLVDGVSSSATVDSKPKDYGEGNISSYFIEVGTSNADSPPVGGEHSVYNLVGDHIYYNPLHENGVLSFSITGSSASAEYVYVSDDLSNWTFLTNVNGDYTVPVNLRNSKFWKFTSPASVSRVYDILPVTPFDGINIHFAVAPPDGAIITANYTTGAIAKDEEHVFDMTVTITLNEYAGT